VTQSLRESIAPRWEDAADQDKEGKNRNLAANSRRANASRWYDLSLAVLGRIVQW
jgi:hypothetical protein